MGDAQQDQEEQIIGVLSNKSQCGVKPFGA